MCVFIYFYINLDIDRQSTPHNIHATPTTAEEEELESEFTNMKVHTTCA